MKTSDLGRTELIALGRAIVTDRLTSLGCTVASPNSGKLDVRTPSGRALEVFLSTQRIGGYAFWTKRRFQPASNRFAAIVLLTDTPEPHVYLIPSAEWMDPRPPLKDRPNVGKRSEPEYGITLARSSLPELQRYAWGNEADDYFR